MKKKSTRFWAKLLGLGLSLVPVAEALATITLLPTGSPRQIILRVGSNNGTVNRVDFDVSGANLAQNPQPVQGVPTNGAPATSPAGGVEIFLQTRNRNVNGVDTTIFLTADSSSGLTCQSAASCGSTVIPFNTISWISYNQATNYPGLDIQNGTFDNSTSQRLIGVRATNTSVSFSNVLVFTYNNATIYPAGVYQGRVTYTASMP
ncbi:MAG: hypothetical protein AB7S56_07500 [Halothiobacillaceae bacterium]